MYTRVFDSTLRLLCEIFTLELFNTVHVSNLVIVIVDDWTKLTKEKA